jgi:hypothetical protein
MAEQNKQPETAPAAPKLVRVRVKKAVVVGGLVLRPVRDGEKLREIEAYVPAEAVKLHGPEYLVEVGEAPAGAKVGPVPAR